MIELIFRDAAHDREIRVRKAVGSGEMKQLVKNVR